MSCFFTIWIPSITPPLRYVANVVNHRLLFLIVLFDCVLSLCCCLFPEKYTFNPPVVTRLGLTLTVRTHCTSCNVAWCPLLSHVLNLYELFDFWFFCRGQWSGTWFCWLKPLSSSSHWPDILVSSILSCFVRIPLECGRGIISFFVIYCGSIYSLYICSVSLSLRQSISISIYLCADIGWNADCEILNHNVMSRWLLLALESSLVVWEVLNFVLLNAMWYGNYYVVLSFGFLL